MPQKLFDTPTQLRICDYYWTRLPSGYYPSYKETAVVFGCSNAHVRDLLKKHGYPRRTNAETRDHRPCKPINQPDGPAPLCACGCGQLVQWASKKQKWQRFAPGHYIGQQRKSVQPTYGKGPHQRKRYPRSPNQSVAQIEPETLTQLYVVEHHTMEEIASMFCVGQKSIRLALIEHNIPIRTHSENLVIRGSVRGPNNPAWKGGIADWDYSPDWKRLCKQIKDRDHWTCQLCNEQRKYWGIFLHVHHIDGDKFNNHPHNLISLCATCHHPIHNDPLVADRLSAIAIRNTGETI